MTNEKFTGEVATLKKFFEIYCNDKHTNQKAYNEVLLYRNNQHNVELNLCDECKALLNYSFEKLKGCPHEIKPRCRTCPTPCYDKQEWKQVAKLMKYSGIQLGLSKLKKFLRLK